MGERTDWKLVAAAAGSIVVAVWIGIRIPAAQIEHRALSVGPPAAGTPLDFPPLASGSPSSGETSHPAGADALSSPPGAGSTLTDVERLETPTGESPGGVYSQSFAFQQLETPHEAVLATTLDIWSHEAFKTLTLAEVRALGVETDYDLSGDGLLLDRIGGLPTEEDVIDALDHPEVVDALQKFLVADGIWLEFAMKKTTSRELLELARQATLARDAAQDGLYKALDSSSSYKNWELLGAIWRAMDRE